MQPTNPNQAPQGPIPEVPLDPTPISGGMGRRELLTGLGVVGGAGIAGVALKRLLGRGGADTVAGWHVDKASVTVDCPPDGGTPTGYNFDVVSPAESWNNGPAKVTADGQTQMIDVGEKKTFASPDNQLDGTATWDTNGSGQFGDTVQRPLFDADGKPVMDGEVQKTWPDPDEVNRFSFEVPEGVCVPPTTTTEAPTTTTSTTVVGSTTTTGQTTPPPTITGQIVSPPATTTTTTTMPPRPPASSAKGN